MRRIALVCVAGTLLATSALSALGAAPIPAAEPGPPILTFLTQPGATTSGGQPFTVQPVVRDVDAAGNPRPGDPVLLSIVPGTGTPEAILTCDQNPVPADVTGRATFTGCRIDKAGSGYVLLAQVDRVPGTTALSTAINVSVGPPVRLTFVQVPTFAFISHPFDLAVGISDAGGNPVAAAAGTITVDIDPETIEVVTLTCPGGTTHATTAGVAKFTGCTLDEPIASGEDIFLRTTVTNVSGVPPLDPVQSEPIALQDATEAPLNALNLARSSSNVTYGQAVTFTVSFVGGPARPLNLQRSDDGGELWFTIAPLTTSAAGTATFAYKPRTTGLYRVVYEGPPLVAAGRSDEITVIVKELAVQSPQQSSPKSIKRGAHVTFTTTARPIGADLPRVFVEFSVYRLVSGSWRLLTTRTVRTDTAGKAVMTWTFATAGDWYVRSKAFGSQGEVGQPGRTADSSPTKVARYRVP